jgi:transposase
MAKNDPHYLRNIIKDENLSKYASRAGATSFQKAVVKTYLKGVNESQLAQKYDVSISTIHEAIRGYITICRRYTGQQANPRKMAWLERVKPESDFLSELIDSDSKDFLKVNYALIETSRIAVNKGLQLEALYTENADDQNKERQKEIIEQLRTLLSKSQQLLDKLDDID